MTDDIFKFVTKLEKKLKYQFILKPIVNKIITNVVLQNY